MQLIGIFPADPEHIWAKLQGPLGLTPPEIKKKGDDRVYVRFEEAAELIHELGGHVSVHVGRKSNSIENIGNNPPYKQAVKDDLARAHIDLFEIGRIADENTYREKENSSKLNSFCSICTMRRNVNSRFTIGQ